MKFKLLKIIIVMFCLPQYVFAKQSLPDCIIKNTISIEAKSTGQIGVNYFYCINGQKCSTEDVVREYYKNKGYFIMRAEYTFWKGMFTLAFYDEIFSVYKFYYSDIPNDMSSEDFYENRKVGIENKHKLIKKTNLKTFINFQISANEPFNTRLLYPVEIEGYPNPVDYFKSPVVQEFLGRIDNKTFAKIVYRIAKYPALTFRGTPDYIIWNKKELIFIEVKRENEKLTEEQIEWGEFLIKNKISYKIVRVSDKI